MARKNARIDAHILGLLFENPAPSWTAKRAEIEQHRMHAAAARQQARYDADAREAVEYHDAEAERLEDELEAAGHLRPRGARYRKNPAYEYLTHELGPETKTQAFKRWFGKSKVVDDRGRPRVVFHGTDNGGFYAFEPNEIGLFFSSSEDLAESYVRALVPIADKGIDPTPPLFSSFDQFLLEHSKYEEPFEVEKTEDGYKVFFDGQHVIDFMPGSDDEEEFLAAVNSQTTRRSGVYAVYLRIENPFVVNAKGANWNEIELGGKKYTTNELAMMARDRLYLDFNLEEDEPRVRECDGLILNNVGDSGGGGDGYADERGTVYVVFDPTQIKSAYNNVGTFDPEDDDIRKNPPRRKRKNPRGVARAPDEDVDDWVTIEECGCHTCTPARMNPRAAKRAPEGAYGDLKSIMPVIANALSQHGLTMGNVELKFTRGGKSRAGACAYSRSRNQCQIMFNGLAWPAFTEEQRLNTVLHEAAHAIQFLTTGRSDHGPVWTRIAQSIGCTGDRCMTVEASQAMVDAYSEAKGLPKHKVVTRETAMEASGDFVVGDYVSFDHKRATWSGKIVSKSPTHATVLVQDPPTKAGLTGKIPYPLLQKTAPPRFAEKVAGVDKPAAGETLTAWQARTGRARANPAAAENGRYRYVMSCPNATSEDIHALQESEKDVSRLTFAKAIGPQAWREIQANLGYDRDFSIKTDWHVGYYKGVFRGVPCYFLRHSHIEYIYTLDGKLGPSSATDDGDDE